MRIIVALCLLLMGCWASGGRVRATYGEEGVRFLFDQSGKPIRLMGIDVYEYTAGGRGKTMCTLRRVSAWDRDVMNVQTWVYGRDVGEHYVAESCSPLSPGREYGVNVSQNSHCISSTHFRLTPDGAVVDLGPNDIACIM